MKRLFYPLTLFLLFFLAGCVNKHGISLKYYSDCKEYYDLQGHYHKECGDDDIVTYEGIEKTTTELIKKKPQRGNVW